jgi:sugar lactone lactonase YvrE
MDLETVCGQICELGEGPVWDTNRNSIIWIDIITGQIHEYSFATNSQKTHAVNEMIGSFAICKNGNLVLATKSGFGFLDRETGEIKNCTNPETDLPNNRFNDGKCDPAGRFWAGSMSLTENKNTGNLYVFEKNKCNKKLENLTISNGLAWSGDHKTMYFIDTPTMQIVSFDYDKSTGNIAQKRTIINFPSNEGYPDGMTIDSEGMLWIAHWGGWRVSRWNPNTGNKLTEIKLPAANITSCTFGGDKLQDLFITSAKKGLNKSELASQPLAGAIFIIRNCGFNGLPAFKYED